MTSTLIWIDVFQNRGGNIYLNGSILSYVRQTCFFMYTMVKEDVSDNLDTKKDAPFSVCFWIIGDYTLSRKKKWIKNKMISLKKAEDTIFKIYNVFLNRVISFTVVYFWIDVVVKRVFTLVYTDVIHVLGRQYCKRLLYSADPLNYILLIKMCYSATENSAG